jgi:DNA processing protein
MRHCRQSTFSAAMPLSHTPPELAAWIRLSQEPTLGVLGYALLRQIGLPDAIYAMRAATLQQHVPADLARQMAGPPSAEITASIEAAMRWCALPGHHIVTLADAAYPQQLLTIADPPLLLYVRGNPALLARAGLAVVGARSASSGGIENAQAFARYLATHGWTIVSGLALGIDAAAHEGALSAGLAGGGTVAVVGCGVDIVYPRQNGELAERIAQHGAVVSEYALGAPPMKHHFPQRNRLVAGLAQGVLVVEAASQSGSLLTARLAADSGREVFAIPGSIHSPLSRGCHALIRQGAKLVETAKDITDELGGAVAPAGSNSSAWRPAHTVPDPAARRRTPKTPVPRRLPPEAPAASDAGADTATAGGSASASAVPRPAINAAASPPHAAPAGAGESAEGQQVLAALGYDPVDLDTLHRRTGVPVASLSTHLLQWELAGIVERLPGGRFQRLGGLRQPADLA